MHVRIFVMYLHSYDSDPERYSDLLDMLDMNSEITLIIRSLKPACGCAQNTMYTFTH